MESEFLAKKDEACDKQDDLNNPSDNVLGRKAKNRFQIMVEDDRNTAYAARHQIQRQQESDCPGRQNQAAKGNQKIVDENLLCFWVT